MTIYGTEFQFTIPAGTDADTFGDRFDSATNSLGASEGYYSIDAALSGQEMFVLVGISVPDDVDADDFFKKIIDSSFIPLLVSAGVEASTIKANATQSVMALA